MTTRFWTLLTFTHYLISGVCSKAKRFSWKASWIWITNQISTWSIFCHFIVRSFVCIMVCWLTSLQINHFIKNVRALKQSYITVLVRWAMEAFVCIIAQIHFMVSDVTRFYTRFVIKFIIRFDKLTSNLKVLSAVLTSRWVLSLLLRKLLTFS